MFLGDDSIHELVGMAGVGRGDWSSLWGSLA